MTNVSLKISTRECIPDNQFLGYEGENEVNKLIFKFEDGFFDGSALLNVHRGEQQGYVTLDKVGETYELPVSNSLLSQKGDVRFQLVITTTEGKVIKFDPFVMTVKDAIDTDVEMPEEYPSWIDEANAKLAEMDKAIEDAEKLDARVDQTENGALITIVGRDGTTTAEVLHGTGEGSGGGIVAETDPVYMQDKPNIALKSEIPTNLSQLNNDSGFITEDELNGKVDKEAGKSLIDNTEIERLKNVTNYDDAEIRQQLNNKAEKSEIPDITTKQDTLVSGTNIKTINGQSVLGSGNITIEGGSGGGSVSVESNPIGAIISFMGLNAPEGYLICDGAELNIADYSALATHFETQFGTKNHFGGDGTTTFALPDLRNEFLRGYHCEASEQLSGEVGIHQDATKHVVYANDTAGHVFFASTLEPTNADITGGVRNNTIQINGSNITSPGTDLYYTSRPTNVAVLYCIKYTNADLKSVATIEYVDGLIGDIESLLQEV